MIIIGIDPALNNTGFAIAELLESKNDRDEVIQFCGRYIRLLEIGVIKTSCKDKLSNRLLKIYNNILQLIKKYSPQKIVIEKLYSHYNHPRTAILMGHARGIIMLAGKILDVEVINLPATKVKKSVTGRGNASKHQVSNMVKHIFTGYDIPESYDITDALALIISCINMNKLRIKGSLNI